jgi:hypothetical protein
MNGCLILEESYKFSEDIVEVEFKGKETLEQGCNGVV